MRSETENLTSSRRDENSLFILTKKFIDLLYNSPEQHINMTQAAMVLKVSKRRIYDITNVLESTGMISKWSVNDVKWTGGSAENILGEAYPEEDQDIFKNVTAEELQLDNDIERLNKEITEISSNEKNLENAYVTYEDLQRLRTFQDKLVFAVKVPNETKIEYPRYEKGAYRLRILAERGQISVFYVNDEGEGTAAGTIEKNPSNN